MVRSELRMAQTRLEAHVTIAWVGDTCRGYLRVPEGRQLVFGAKRKPRERRTTTEHRVKSHLAERWLSMAEVKNWRIDRPWGR